MNIRFVNFLSPYTVLNNPRGSGIFAFKRLSCQMVLPWLTKTTAFIPNGLRESLSLCLYM